MKRFAFATLLALLPLTAFAQVSVKDAWVRGTVVQQKATGAFMELKADKDARLVSVKSPVAGVVEIHEMAMDKNVMRMRALPNGLELPAGKSVELKPGGYHVMLMDLKQQMKEGDSVPMTLVIEDKDKKQTTIEIKVPVKALGAKVEHSHKH
jgi:copper(I)-binding protein